MYDKLFKFVKEAKDLIGSHIQENAAIVGAQLKESAVLIGSHVQENAEVVGTQVKESAVLIGSHVQENAEVVGTQVKESAVLIGSHVQENAEVVGTQVKEGAVLIGSYVHEIALNCLSAEFKNKVQAWCGQATEGTQVHFRLLKDEGGVQGKRTLKAIGLWKDPTREPVIISEEVISLEDAIALGFDLNITDDQELEYMVT